MKIATTLAVGTELTDGQTTNRNSSWLAERCIEFGMQVAEHRVVPDDRPSIKRALDGLLQISDLLFVTGGLGPTSDDFTREVIAEFAGCRLEFSESNWLRVQTKLQDRGVPVNSIQRQQAWFPNGSTILENPAGTADSFLLNWSDKTIVALPGPPSEISSIWEAGLKNTLAQKYQVNAMEMLRVFRCLGRGESEIALSVEKTVTIANLRIGYRVARPYVEVKIWYQPEDNQHLRQLELLEQVLSPWLVNIDQEDLAVQLATRFAAEPGAELGTRLRIRDAATAGNLARRLNDAFRRLGKPIWIYSETQLPFGSISPADLSDGSREYSGGLEVYATNEAWHITIVREQKVVCREVIQPPYRYQLNSDLAISYITELVLLKWRESW